MSRGCRHKGIFEHKRPREESRRLRKTGDEKFTLIDQPHPEINCPFASICGEEGNLEEEREWGQERCTWHLQGNGPRRGQSSPSQRRWQVSRRKTSKCNKTGGRGGGRDERCFALDSWTPIKLRKREQERENVERG